MKWTVIAAAIGAVATLVAIVTGLVRFQWERRDRLARERREAEESRPRIQPATVTEMWREIREHIDTTAGAGPPLLGLPFVPVSLLVVLVIAVIVFRTRSGRTRRFRTSGHDRLALRVHL